MPGQEQRSKSVRRKLNAIDLEFRGKNVLLVDDSIVRGTTSAQIIELAREAGARKVYFASAAPPVTFPNVYGIDMPATSELVASCRDATRKWRELIGADWLIYQDLEDLIAACVHDIPASRNSTPRVSRVTTSPATSRRNTWRGSSQERSDSAKATRRDAERGGLKIVKT